MTNGRISINTDYANSIVSYLNSSISNLDGNISSKLSSNFNPFTESGLVSDSLTKVQNQTREITSLEQSIASAISVHIDDVTNEENKLYNDFMRGLVKSNSLSETTNDKISSTGNNIDIYEVEDGKKINTSHLTETIETLTNDEIESLLILLEMNKNSDVSLKELLLDNDISKELYVNLTSILSNSENMEEISVEDTKEVQKILLNSIINGEVSNIELDTNSILIAKEYLDKISKENNISGSDLLFDSSYSNVLKESLSNLYNGNVNDISSETINNFKKYIDNIAFKENVTVDDLINNKVELIY